MESEHEHQEMIADMEDCDPLPGADWSELLRERLTSECWAELRQWLDRDGSAFYPPPVDVFRALELTWFRGTKVVIVGQDPYPNEGQADGLCFSVRRGVEIPPSLRNIRKELHADQPDVAIPDHGSLEAWAREGVLLLNAALTVSPRAIGSHRRRWKQFTNEVIKLLSEAKAQRIVFMLWGRDAQQRARLIDESRHAIIRSSHPSPRSASRPCGDSPPFLDSGPFSEANEFLVKSDQEPVNWSLT